MNPFKRMREFVSVAAATYNTASSHFLCGISDAVHIWDMRTGLYLRKYSNFVNGSRDVSAMCLDMPRQRRVFVGLEDGKVVTVKYVTGEQLSWQQVHTADVTSMIFCDETKCLITTGAEGSIHIRREVRANLQGLRAAHHAHSGIITCCAYRWA